VVRGAPPAAALLRPIGSETRLAVRQVRYEQLAFWRNPFGAAFTVVFSVVFLVFLGASGGKFKVLGDLRAVDYYTPGFVAYGVMAASFNILSIRLVVNREMGLLKRLRLTPLPTWALFGGMFGSTLIVCLVEVVLLILVGRFGYQVPFPRQPAALALALLVGVFCFFALGVAASTFIPNQDAAGPIISIVYFVLLFISGLWFPLSKGSTLAAVGGWFPVRHFLLAVFAPFDPQPGTAAFAGHDLLVVAIWGAAALGVALRRFRWEPRRA
jgi:ABC-2 type transport system permease protein